MTETLLPDSWTSVQLADLVVNAQSGFASGDKAVEGGISHLRMNNIGSDGELALDLIRTVPEKLAKQTYALGHGDILVCTTNSSKLVGKTALFNLAGRYVFSNHLTRLRPVADLIDSRFLHWNLWLHWKRGGFEDKCKHWVNQSTLPKEELLATEIPFPPIAEQRRIAVKVEKVLEKVSRSVERLERIPTILKRFRQSVLAAASSGRLTADWREQNPGVEDAKQLIAGITQARKERYKSLCEEAAKSRQRKPSEFDNLVPALRHDLDLYEVPETWQWVDLRYLMNPEEDFCYGVVQPGDDDPEGPRLVRVCDLEGGKIKRNALRGIPPDVHQEYGRSILSGGEILVSVVGTIGRTAIAQPEMAGVNIARAVAKVPVREFNSLFVSFWLSSSRAESWMVGDSREVARKTLNLEQLRTLPAPLPPKVEQDEIVRRVESLFTLADQLEARYKKGKAYVDKLTQSILAKAFRGELVPQDPNDEPAEKLLERIRAAKQKS